MLDVWSSKCDARSTYYKLAAREARWQLWLAEQAARCAPPRWVPEHSDLGSMHTTADFLEDVLEGWGYTDAGTSDGAAASDADEASEGAQSDSEP
jgi:hypothetical protein